MQGNDGIDYKKKYMDLRARFVESLDVAFRTGYEQGANEAQIQSMAQQAQQMNAMAGTQGGMPSGGPESQGGAPSPGMEQPGMPGQPEQPEQSSDEMDQAISQLEELVNKSEDLSMADLKKTIDLMKSEHTHRKMLKATKSIDITPKAFSQSYKSNMNNSSKASVAMQQKIVDDILRKWESEEAGSSRDITHLLGTEALTKKEK